MCQTDRYECSCGFSTRANETEKTGHSYQEITNVLTGKVEYVCMECGHKFTGTVVPIQPPVEPPVESVSIDGENAVEPAVAGTTPPDSIVVETHDYVYTGGKLVREFVTSRKNGTTIIDGYQLDFSYDANGLPLAASYVNYQGTRGTYYYVTNIQGDVMAILDTSGEVVVEYVYDAWGNVRSVTGDLADTIGERNPLRYRGYVYDQETEYYYLQSRYYDPETGRFINSDAFASTGCGLLGSNMYAYCNNGPVIFVDSAGMAPWPITVVINDGASRDYLKDAEDIGVTFKPSESGKGGRIENSYRITDKDEMTAYADYLVNSSSYKDYFDGSVEGVVFEWWLHNLIFSFTDESNTWHERAKSVDIGSTLYDDTGHGMYSLVMILLYEMSWPEQAARDKEIHQMQGGE